MNGLYLVPWLFRSALYLLMLPVVAVAWWDYGPAGAIVALAVPFTLRSYAKGARSARGAR